MAEEDESLVSVATWRVLTLFLFIIAIDLICEFGNEAITHHFRHKQQSGLLHAWEQLKFETMALGLVSLLLIIGEVRKRLSRGSVSCLMGGLWHVFEWPHFGPRNWHARRGLPSVQTRQTVKQSSSNICLCC